MPFRSLRAAAFAIAVAFVGCTARNETGETHLVSSAGGVEVRFSGGSDVVGEPQTMTVQLARDGVPVDGARTTLAWGMKGMPMGARPFTLKRVAAGTYRSGGFVFSMPGTWSAHLRAVGPGGFAVVTTFTVEARE